MQTKNLKKTDFGISYGEKHQSDEVINNAPVRKSVFCQYWHSQQSIVNERGKSRKKEKKRKIQDNSKDKIKKDREKADVPDRLTLVTE